MILYLLLCQGNTFYTGITPDLEKRLAAHLGLVPGGARATRMRKPLDLAAAWIFPEDRDARSREVRLKRLTHLQKEALARDPEGLFSLFPGATGQVLDPAPFRALFFKTPGKKPGCKG